MYHYDHTAVVKMIEPLYFLFAWTGRMNNERIQVRYSRNGHTDISRVKHLVS